MFIVNVSWVMFPNQPDHWAYTELLSIIVEILPYWEKDFQLIGSHVKVVYPIITELG